MAIRGGYAPPGVYTETIFESPTPAVTVTGSVPLLIGKGRETTEQKAIAMVRGSSAVIDNQVVGEDPAGHAVSGFDAQGFPILSDFNGTITKVQVQHYPIVNGEGIGKTSTNPSDVQATINGQTVLVLSIDGAKGVVGLSQAPQLGDEVRLNYYFKRTDTLVSDEDVSAQVSPDFTYLYAGAGDFVWTSSTNKLILTVDNVVYTTTITAPIVGADRENTLDRVINTLNSLNFASLVASKYTTNAGVSNLLLKAEGSIVVGSGSINSALGLTTGSKGSSRTTTFYTSNYPIVAGNNGGRTTTTVTDITVKVNGIKVTPTSLDGQSGAFTLSQPPVIGSTVTVTYFFNTFRDQFDYIPARNVSAVTRNSLVPSGGGASSQFIQGADWVLHNDTIVWGSSALVSPKTTNGALSFGEDQIALTLRDEKAVNVPCTLVAGSSNIIKLPYQPVDGSGMGIPTASKSLVTVKVGYGLADAIEKENAVINRIDPATSQVTLQTAVPAGATAFATFYYNTLTDNAESSDTAFLMTVNSAGVSNVGTYTMTKQGATIYGASLNSKGSALNTIDINFPTGSSLFPDFRFENGTPVEEEVTVQFTSGLGTSATYTSKGTKSFYLVPGQSDTFDLDLDGNNIVVNMQFPCVNGAVYTSGLTALVGDYAGYTASSNFNFLEDVTAGDTFNITIDGKAVPISFPGLVEPTLYDIQDILNTNPDINLASSYVAMSPFSGSIIITAGKQNLLSFTYTGDDSGTSDVFDIEIPADTYSVDGLLSAINTEIANLGLSFNLIVEKDSSSRLVFSLTALDPADQYGYIEFLAQAIEEEDFAVIAGIDTDISAGGSQTKFGLFPMMDVVDYDLNTINGERRQRAIIRNNIVLGSNYFPPSTSNYGIQIPASSIATSLGLSGASVEAFKSAVMQQPTLPLRLFTTWSNKANSQPVAKFYNGIGTIAQNDTLSFDFNGKIINVTFPSSDNGTSVQFGPVSKADSVLGLIKTALIDAGASSSLLQIGFEAKLAIASEMNPESYIRVLSGSANSLFGLRANQVFSSKPVEVNQLVSAFYNCQQTEGDFNTTLFLNGSPSVDSFLAYAVAYETVDASGNHHLSFDSLSTGLSSTLKFNTAGNAISTIGTGLLIPPETTVQGEEGLSGFFVTSNTAGGSGSANTSLLNNSVGQDGFINQTYVDAVTGLTFTILPLDGGQEYPVGVNSFFTIKSSAIIKTNANIPRLVIPGVQMVVSNTSGLVIGDQAIVETFDKSGAEPNIGEQYYIDIVKQKTNLNTTILFNSITDVIAEYGDLSSQNTLSLGAYFAFLNGSSTIACRQLPLLSNEADLTEGQVIEALSDIEGQISSGIYPKVILPLIPASDSLLAAISRHCDIQSSIRYRAERTAILGCSAGTSPQEAARLATVAGSARVRLLYPDIVSATVTDTFGKSVNLILDGRYLAVALASATTSAAVDAATPWDRRPIVGFGSLARTLDAVQANQTAQNGVTILEQNGLTIRVRHGLTTDMTSILTRTPTVAQITDEVHRRSRDLFDSYIGLKFLPSILNQVEGRTNAMFKDLVSQKIIDSFTGIKVTVDPNDPTGLLIEAYYKPVFPLLYIQFTFNVRSSI